MVFITPPSSPAFFCDCPVKVLNYHTITKDIHMKLMHIEYNLNVIIKSKTSCFDHASSTQLVKKNIHR